MPRSHRTATNRTVAKRITARRGPKKGTVKINHVLAKALILAVIVSGCYLGWQSYIWVIGSEAFQIAGVDVSGVRHVSQNELKNIAGVFTGQNIFRVNLEEAVRRARANPWVKEVRIYRRLPNRVSMVVSERLPAAVLDTGPGQFLVDSEGVIIDRLSKESASAQPLPTVAIKDYKARLGDQVGTEGMAEALTLLAELSARGGWKLAEITIKANSPETLSVMYADYEFKLGSGNYSEKLRRLAEVMADVKQRNLNIAYVDLRPERQAAVMVVKNGVQGPGIKNKGRR
ncbi:MAG TPA: FtsQ-type POTRA domain-containing protein [Nitrospirota bacterium]|nr:FtsQ-type POTRA domain-containing protein [Nitrospirota bacterium]